MMSEWASTINDVSPDLMIFHVSRCGSTLLTQLLSCSTDNIVLSEVPFFDELLRLPFKKEVTDREVIDRYLKSAISLYSRQPQSRGQRLFIKTDSWHIHFYDQLRRLFPATIFILLYRDPLEVLQSQQRQRGLQSVPGLIEPELFGFCSLESQETDLDRYMAKVMETYFSKMISIIKTDPLTFAFDYSDGMIPVAKKIYNLLNQPLTLPLEEEWTKRSRYHAKHPQQLFNEAKVNWDQPKYLQLVMELYHQLASLNNPEGQLAEDKLH